VKAKGGGSGALVVQADAHGGRVGGVPACVRPAHLEPVTNQENVLRGMSGGLAAHCPQGHPYDEANTYRDDRGHRFCRACNREAVRRYKAKRKGAVTPGPVHPTDLELVEWVDGNLRGTPEHGEIARHLVACQECAGLLLGQEGRNADVAYELLRTSWRELRP